MINGNAIFTIFLLIEWLSKLFCEPFFVLTYIVLSSLTTIFESINLLKVVRAGKN